MPVPAVDVLPLWIFLVGLAVFYYVLFDGFDLGVGILYGLTPDRNWRGAVMASIAPIWDGNETWLILGGVGLFAIFPLAFVIIIPALYFPILFMLLALVFRGVAFELRFKQPRLLWFWDRAFSAGSLVAAFAQGVMVGTFVQGFKVKGGIYIGSSFDWATGFAMFCGISLVFGYTLIGAGWLVIKTDGALQAWARRAGRWCLVITVMAIAGVSIWTVLTLPYVANRWLSHFGGLEILPILTAAVAATGWLALRPSSKSEFLPFLSAIGLFVLSYVSIVISLWPMIVPFHYTVWQAAASNSTQVFLLIGTMFLLPIIVGYTFWSYWIFRGKVRGDFGYH